MTVMSTPERERATPPVAAGRGFGHLAAGPSCSAPACSSPPSASCATTRRPHGFISAFAAAVLVVLAATDLATA